MQKHLKYGAIFRNAPHSFHYTEAIFVNFVRLLMCAPIYSSFADFISFFLMGGGDKRLSVSDSILRNAHFSTIFYRGKYETF